MQIMQTAEADEEGKRQGLLALFLFLFSLLAAAPSWSHAYGQAHSFEATDEHSHLHVLSGRPSVAALKAAKPPQPAVTLENSSAVVSRVSYRPISDGLSQSCSSPSRASLNGYNARAPPAS